MISIRRNMGEDAKSYCGTIMPMRDSQDVDLARYIINETGKAVLESAGESNSQCRRWRKSVSGFGERGAGSAIISMIYVSDKQRIPPHFGK